MIDAIFAAQGRLPPQRGRDVPAAVSDSVDYQILRRTLMPDAPDVQAAAEELNQASTAPAPSGSSDQGVQVAQFQAVIDQRDLQLNVSASVRPQRTDPLALDLAGNGFATRGLEAPVTFDLDADGRRDQISVPTGDDALLALDRNANGRIDDGRELFGDQHGAANGFAELAKLDDNRDGRLDLQDALFERLTLLRFDDQGRQHSQSLAEAGVSVIHLQHQEVKVALGAYDEIAQLGRFDFEDGRQGQAADLLLSRR
ncbi:MAG: hypothetical protein ABWY06_07485 [Pseudomonas sp.]|uniref:hypothetical protein n=1 Tax=Pseudomonas sp. TaxID=306 RepID=UPI003398573E